HRSAADARTGSGVRDAGNVPEDARTHDVERVEELEGEVAKTRRPEVGAANPDVGISEEALTEGVEEPLFTQLLALLVGVGGLLRLGGPERVPRLEGLHEVAARTLTGVPLGVLRGVPRLHDQFLREVRQRREGIAGGPREIGRAS